MMSVTARLNPNEREIATLIRARLEMIISYESRQSLQAPGTPLVSHQAVADKLYANHDQRSLEMTDEQLFAYYRENAEGLAKVMNALCKP